MRKLHSETPAWCPGCGNYGILPSLDKAIEEGGVDRRRLVLVSGIGQAAKLPHYTKANIFNGLHGRALPHATGIKLANHELEVVVTSGDGDIYGEGGNHFVHTLRRNIGVKCFVHNNQVYGLTKGQASPTSDCGMETPIQRHGVMLKPFNPLAVAIVEGASLVMRSFSNDRDHLSEMMVTAFNHDGGFVLLDILQPCPTFNRRNTAKWYSERIKPVGDAHDPEDLHAALDTAMTWGDDIPVGVIYRNPDRPKLEDLQPVLKKGPLMEQYGG